MTNKQGQSSEILTWTIGIIFILYFLIGTNTWGIGDTYEDVKSSITNSLTSEKINVEDPLVEQCLASLNQCMDIVESRSDTFRWSLITYEKFEEENSESKRFREIYQNSAQSLFFALKEAEYPVVYLAIKTPKSLYKYYMLLCDTNGELVHESKSAYKC